jgi:hypothetical protein
MNNILNFYVLLIFCLPALIIFSFQFIEKITSSIFLFKNKDLLFLVILLILFGMLTLILFNKGNFIISNKQLIFMTLFYLIFCLILFYFDKMKINYLIGLCFLVIFLEIVLISFNINSSFYTLKRVIEDLYVQLIFFYVLIAYKFKINLKS